MAGNHQKEKIFILPLHQEHSGPRIYEKYTKTSLAKITNRSPAVALKAIQVYKRSNRDLLALSKLYNIRNSKVYIDYKKVLMEKRNRGKKALTIYKVPLPLDKNDTELKYFTGNVHELCEEIEKRKNKKIEFKKSTIYQRLERIQNYKKIGKLTKEYREYILHFWHIKKLKRQSNTISKVKKLEIESEKTKGINNFLFKRINI